jgi:hypothetical protein
MLSAHSRSWCNRLPAWAGINMPSCPLRKRQHALFNLQLGRTAVSPATKAFEYCGHNLNDLSLRAYRLYQDATQLLGRMPQ